MSDRIEKISKAYSKIDELMDEIETLLRAAEDYPAEISKEDAQQVQSFLETAGKAIREYFPLFVGFSDE